MMDSSTQSESEDGYSFFAGQVLDKDFEIKEEDLASFEMVAEQEGMSLDEFVDNLDAYIILSTAVDTAQQEILSWDTSKEDLPSQDSIETLHTQLTRATASAPQFQYDEFGAWMPTVIDDIKHALTDLSGLYDTIEDTQEMEDRWEDIPIEDSLMDDLQDAKDELYTSIQEIISILQDICQAVSTPSLAGNVR